MPPPNRYPLNLLNRDIPEECLVTETPPSRDAAAGPRRRGRPCKKRDEDTVATAAIVAPSGKRRLPEKWDEIPVQVSPEAPKRAKTLLERPLGGDKTGLRRSARVRMAPANRYPFIILVHTKRELNLINRGISDEYLVSAISDMEYFKLFIIFEDYNVLQNSLLCFK
ncbi:unnamed protein product [Acanthoscelides obtectus]|uniref:Uncharacterized protein n=1 Tax=Acanthoscelides obtectus TaxID=200917 RepID=A0A9P0LS43_ACAOB|nr:unnamed protein product [Acanthoscelides obtectus]CAK1671563.1 hypothetical protein AOBTE_LOCUS28319 [Acanthoscelides obtectus]